MTKPPKVDHEYNADKDKLKITVHRYSLKSKKSRDSIVKNVLNELERSSAPLIAKAKKQGKKGSSKKLPGHRRDRETMENGD